MTPIKELRRHMTKRRIDGVLVSMTDPFQNDYVPPVFQRIRYLTGFTGSYGLCLVLKNKAALFIDGRYTLQAHSEVDTTVFEIHPYGWASVKSWLAQYHPSGFPKGLCIAYDPWTFVGRDITAMEALKASLGCTFIPSPSNDVDAIRPVIDPLPSTAAFTYDIACAGETAVAKIDQARTALKKHSIDYFIFFDPLSLCWLLNIRGNDIPYTPVCFCYGILEATGHMHLFIDPQKMPLTVQQAIGSPITLHPIETLEGFINKLMRSSVKIGYDPETSLGILHQWMEEKPKNFIPLKDPSALPRACKNATEVTNAHQAHIYDGICLARFFAWCHTHWTQGHTGYTLTQKLEALRADIPAYRSLSFPAIVGVDPQSSMAHYRAEPNTALPVTANSILLIDSGSQYVEGTTDVTRTVFWGSSPSAKQKRVYTLVLKGLITLTQARFPKGTRGCQLDVLARGFLWQDGLDYPHSTGHGVGQFLNVHEGPQNISTPLKDVPLEPGMIVSNEPGCYFPGEWGVRIENLMVVVDTGEVDLLGRPRYAFDTLTLVPIPTNLIDRSLLIPSEIQWLNAYHAQVYRTLAPHLQPSEQEWLKVATQLII